MVFDKQWPHAAVFFLFSLSFIAVVLAPRSLSFLPGIIGLLGCGVLVLNREFRFQDIIQSRAVKWVMVLAVTVPALAALSALWSIAPDESLERAQKLALVIIPASFLFVYIAALAQDTLKRWAWMLPAGLAAALIINAADIHGDGMVYRMMREMPPAPLEHIAMFNRASVAQVFAFVPLIFLIRALPIQKPIFAMGGLTLLMLIVLSGTDSQSSQMAFLVAMLAIFIVPHNIKAIYIVIASAIVALTIAAPYIVHAAFTHFATTIGDVEWLTRGYALQRLEIWDMVARKALEGPIFGHGIEATKMVPAFDSQTLYYSETNVLHPHNFALQVWMEFGALGIAALCGFFAALLRTITTLETSMRAMALALFLAILAVGSTGYGIWQSWWIGLICISAALCFIVIRIKKDKV